MKIQEVISNGDRLVGEVSDMARNLEALVMLGNRLNQSQVNRIKEIEAVLSKSATAIWWVASVAKEHVLPELEVVNK